MLPATAPTLSPPRETFDVAVIGAGVVGCAVVRRLALAGAKVVLIEKGSDILSGAPRPTAPFSIRLRRPARQSSNSISSRRAERNISPSPVRSASPWSRPARWSAPGTTLRRKSWRPIAAQGRANGIAALELLSGHAARATMPGLSQRLVAALEVADEHIIDPWTRRSPISPKA